MPECVTATQRRDRGQSPPASPLRSLPDHCSESTSGSARLRIFPVAVFGSSVTTRTCLGTWKPASLPFACAITPASRSASGTVPSATTFLKFSLCATALPDVCIVMAAASREERDV